MSKRLIQLPAVKSRYPKKNSSIYRDIQIGTFVPQIKIGERAVAWIESEVDAVIDALTTGASKTELRDLVQRLVAARQHGVRS